MSIEYLNAAFKADVKPSSFKFVLVSLSDFANENGEAYPSVQTMVNKTAMNKKTVLKYYGELLERGFIRDTGERKGSTKQVIVYQINYNLIKSLEIKKGENSKAVCANTEGRAGNFNKDNDTNIETVPNLEQFQIWTAKEPKIGTLKEAQIWNTEPSVSFNHQKEPSDSELSNGEKEESPAKENTEGSAKAQREFELEESVGKIFGYWQNAMSKSNTRLTDSRVKKIKKELKARTARDICLAIKGCSMSEYHVTNGYNDFSTIFRSDDTVDKHIERAKANRVVKEKPKPSGDFSEIHDRMKNLFDNNKAQEVEVIE